MEIKLKENSNFIIKNHNGDTLCSVDEATGAVTGCGTKLYKHSMNIVGSSGGMTIRFYSLSNIALTNSNLDKWSAVGQNIISSRFASYGDGEVIIGLGHQNKTAYQEEKWYIAYYSFKTSTYREYNLLSYSQTPTITDTVTEL